jgi:hypothetical protein
MTDKNEFVEKLQNQIKGWKCEMKSGRMGNAFLPTALSEFIQRGQTIKLFAHATRL